jgi:hypothetical protein
VAVLKVGQVVDEQRHEEEDRVTRQCGDDEPVAEDVQGCMAVTPLAVDRAPASHSCPDVDVSMCCSISTASTAHRTVPRKTW